MVVEVSPTSDRLQLLSAFEPWDGAPFEHMPVLMKAQGKCTTDHISAAGKWLTYRGHLENISGNLFLGAVNAFSGAVGEGRDPLDGTVTSYPDIAKRLHEAGVRWCAIGDTNYGEGSSREHAAMEPRFRGAAVIFAKSFARIHETNLKKQGVLALVIDDATWAAVGESSSISVRSLPPVPGVPVTCVLHTADGDVEFEAQHTMNAEQVAWFEAGSALNVVRDRLG
jgi:aconitate hydratase